MTYVSKIYLPKKENFLAYIDKVYESGWLSNNGPLVQELEAELQEYLGVENLLTVVNGTTGLQIAMKALELDGEIITSPFTYAATTSAILSEKLRPVYSDILVDTLNMDPSQIEAHITEKTSALMPVHVFGEICDIESIDAIAAKHNLKVIYDAAHTFGVNYKGKNALSYGDISMISFHATKFFHSIEGGALVFRDKEVYERAKIIRNYGSDGPDSVGMVGMNGKMHEISAAMGLCNLKEIDDINVDRKRSFEYYHKELENYVTFQAHNPDATQSYSYIAALFRDFEEMNRVREALAEKEIFPRQYFKPSLDTLDIVGEQEVMHTSRDVASRILVLPLHSHAEIEVCKTIQSIVSPLK